MSNNIILKKSSVGDKVPLASDLEHGELALNFTDGNLFFKNSSNTVATLASTKFVSVTGNVTGGNVITAGQVSATGNVTGNTIIATGNVEIENRGVLLLYETDNSNYIGLRSPSTLTDNFLYTFPTNYGNLGQVLTTNGAGTLTWESAGESSGATSFPNSTVRPVPGSDGNFDLSFNFVQTVQETPFASTSTDAFGVNLGEVYSMMDPVGEVLAPVDLGALT